MTLQQFISVIKRRALIVSCVLAAGFALMFALRNAIPSSYAGVSHVVLVAAGGGRDPSVGIIDLPSIATSTVVLERVRSSLKLRMPLVNLKANVSAGEVGRSSIMAISFRDRSAERAIAVPNAVADQLSQYYDEISTERYDVNVDRLSAELAAQSAKIDALDKEMSGVANSDPFVISDRAVDNITTNLAALQQQRAIAVAELQGDQALAATTAPNPQLLKTARHEILAGNPTYVDQQSATAKDATALNADRATYTGSFPGLPGEVAKVEADDAATNAVAEKALSDPNAYSPSAAAAYADHAKQLAAVAGDTARLKSIDDLLAKNQDALNDIPVTGAKYAQLSAKLSTMQTEYTALASRRANALANRAEASSLGSVVVLDRAIKADTQLVSGRTRAAGVALVLVFALAIGAAFLVESLDPRIRRREQVEELYGIPVVAAFGSKA